MSRLFARARRVQPLSWLVLAVLLLSLLTFIQNRQSQQRFEQAQQSRDDTITEIQSLVRRLDCTRIATFGEVTDLNVLCPKLWEARRSDPVPDFGHPDGVLP